MATMRSEVYLELYRRVYGSERVKKTLITLDAVCVALAALSYVFALIFMGVSELSLMTPLRLIISTGVPFLAVSIMRCVMNLPRPCKVLEMDFLPNKKEGVSFPSRHVFSAFSIGTALCFVMLPLGIFVLVLGVICAACRVCLGNHFIRDVVAGATIGVVCSVLGMLIL